MNSSIHERLKNWDKTASFPYISSILMINKDVPLFEEEHGMLDYDWLLKATENRKCKEVECSVIRHVNGNNLSIDEGYRLADFNMVYSLLKKNGSKKGIKTLCQSRARYYYKLKRYKESRKFFLKSRLTVKNVLYYFTSFNTKIATYIVKKFNVSG